MEHGDSFSGFQLIQTEGQREAPGKLLDATEGWWRAVDVNAQLRQHVIEELQKEIDNTMSPYQDF